jgi:hypothetical protein
MRKSFMALLFCIAVLAAPAARADTITYDFSYSGSAYYVGGMVTGNGSFTFSYTPGGSTGTLTDFSFTDTFTGGTEGDSTFTYSGLGDVAGSAITLIPSTPGAFAQVSINTEYLAGTNAGFGPVDFVLNDSAGTVFDSTGGSNSGAPDFLGGFSDGDGTVDAAPPTAPSSTPEPSSLALLSTGLLGLAGVVRHRLVA